MDHTVIVLCALLLNALFAGPRRWYAALKLTRLAALPVRLVRHIERKLNRDHRKPEDLRLRGFVVVVITILIAVVLGAILDWLFQHNLQFVELLLVAILLPVRPTWDRVMAIRKALRVNDLPAARQELSGTVWKHHALLDIHGVARAAIEYLAVEFSEKIICPVLGYVLLGLPGLFICVTLNFLQPSFAHAPQFGRAAETAQRWLNVIPSRVTALLWFIAACFFPMADPAVIAKRISNPLLDAAPRTLCVEVASAVSRVVLGGPGSPYLSAWTQGQVQKALPADIKRAQTTYALAALFLFVLTGAFF
jgi:cobalamin biosynthesis protein CobD/CbiB